MKYVVEMPPKYGCASIIRQKEAITVSSARTATAQSDYSDMIPKESNGRSLTSSEHVIAEAFSTILRAIGEDPEREGLLDTPARVAKAYTEMFVGYTQDPADLFTVFDGEEYDSMVIVKDIPMVSFCEHHALPFSGVAHVGYVPNGKIVGLSKIARLVDMYAKRLQVQERLTVQIADTMMEFLDPKGVMVVLEATHSCMEMRGVEKHGSTTVTSAIRGVYNDHTREARTEFLRLIGK